MPHTNLKGEWWKQEILAIYNEAIFTGAAPNVSDAYTVNGQPGVLYPCSRPGQRFLKFYYMYRMFIIIYFQPNASKIDVTN
ncbi:laccase-3 [Quercus suber]|uniref:Laccase-3 n=1 Tax=Quercus suber TaxID=58331 RepID=A0AAW0JJ52_QUESU